MSLSTSFVARDEECRKFEAALAKSAAGQPSLLLITGDAGVGKTRFLARATELAHEQSATVVLSHCVELDVVGLPYLPLSEALAQLRKLGDLVDEVAASRPALARLLDADPTLGVPGTEAAGRMQLFDALAAVLTRAGSPEAPLVLIIEDLHWADPSTLDVLRFLIARLRDEPLLIVASYRTDDLHRRHPLRPFLAEISRNSKVDRIDLLPFTSRELRKFTTEIAGSRLAAADFASILERSEGNAFFAEELVTAGVASGELPWTLADVLHARLERLDPPVQRLVRIAAAAGRRVSETLLRTVASSPILGGAPTALDVEAALRESVAQQVLQPEDGARVAFRHALLAEAAYADLLPGEQVSVHRAYLDALADPSVGAESQRAHHALRAHNLPTALLASRDAAIRAEKMLAPAEELQHLEQALSLWDAVPDATELYGANLATVALQAATAASRSGNPGRAVALVRRVLDEEKDDPLRQASLQHVLGRYLLADDAIPEVLDRTASALKVLADEPPSWDRAMTLALYARAALNLQIPELAREQALLALREAQAIGAPGVEADALTTLAVLEGEDVARTISLLTDAKERAHVAGDLDTELRCWFNLTMSVANAGDLPRAMSLAETGTAYAVDHGMAWSIAGMSLRFHGEYLHYLVGELQNPPVDHGPMPDSWGPWFATVRLLPAVARGDADTIDNAIALRADWDVDAQISLYSAAVIDALTWRGRYEEAVTWGEDIIEFLSAQWTPSFSGRIWISALMLNALANQVTRLALGNNSSSDAGLAELLSKGDTILEAAAAAAVDGRSKFEPLGVEGRAWLARAQAEHVRLFAATGQGINDPAMWEKSVAAFEYGYRYELARSRWRWAEALVMVGRRDEAEYQLSLARSDAEVMGAAPLLAAVRKFAGRARLDSGYQSSQSSSGGSGASVLTDREREVLTLVARGLSNRQVGEQLFISAKTVSVHVSNVLAKLGASGRTEAVSIALQRGLISTASEAVSGTAGSGAGLPGVEQRSPGLSRHPR